MNRARQAGVVGALFAALAGCATTSPRYPLSPPVRSTVAEERSSTRPDDTYVAPTWDAIDQSMFAPVSEALAVDVPGRAANANAWDEVPDSSWFTNRLGVRDLSPQEVAQGPCPEAPVPTDTPWTVVSAKRDGADPGFVMETGGERYVVKLDRADNAERATTADVVSSRLYWAVGFDVPCNRIVHFRPSQLTLHPEATAKDELGEETPLDAELLNQILARAPVRDDGTLRANASLFLPGEPIGPWHYAGTTRGDAGDVIPHQDRREVRASRLLGAWFDHIDARSQNTLVMWHEDEGRVQHHLVDFGDNFGFEWRYDRLSKRLGHQTGFDVPTMVADWASLGTIAHPWDRPHTNPRAPLFRDYDTKNFDPVGWRAGYRNPAFARMDDADAAWMARILARMDDELIVAAVKTAELSEPAWEEELIRVLRGRRDAILDAWLRRVSPLGDVTVEHGGEGTPSEVCFSDLAAAAGVYEDAPVDVHTWLAPWEAPAATATVRGPERMCVDLAAGPRPPVPAEAPRDDASRYLVLELATRAVDARGRRLPPARLHLYDLGDEGFALVAIDRPTRARARRPVHVPDVHRPGEDAAWVPRVLLAPAYAVNEFLLRRPIGAVATAAEKHNVGAHIRRVMTFGTNGLVLLTPTFMIDFGSRPSVGASLIVNQGRHGRLTSHFGYGGKGWLAASVRQRIFLDGASDGPAGGPRSRPNRPWTDSQVFFGFHYHRQPDYLFQGLGRAHVDEQTWYSDRSIGGDLGFEAVLGHLDGFRVTGVIEHHTLGPGFRRPRNPQASIDDVFDVRDPKAVPGWGEYLLGAIETDLHLDSRPPLPAAGHGVGLDLGVDIGTNLATGESSFARLGGRVSAYLDLSNGGQRILSFHQDIQLATPLDDTPVPFPELASLGGFEVMRGFRNGALRGFSALATTVQYQWPVWAYLDSFLFVEVGNTFGPWLSDFDPADLRLSAGTGFRTTIDRDAGLVAMVGFGTSRLGRGQVHLDSVRLTIGFDRAF